MTTDKTSNEQLIDQLLTDRTDVERLNVVLQLLQPVHKNLVGLGECTSKMCTLSFFEDLHESVESLRDHYIKHGE